MSFNNSNFRDSISFNQEEHKTQGHIPILKVINQIISISLQGNTEKELLNTCLSVALEITDSQISSIIEVDNNGLLNEVAVSNKVCGEYKQYYKSDIQHPHRNFYLNCLYGRIIENRKSFHINKPISFLDDINIHQNHLPLTSFLGVPLLVKEKAIGILVVANREGGYSLKQLEDLEAIAPAVTQAFRRIKEDYEYKKADNALLDAYEQIQAQTDELNMQSDELKKINETLEEKVKERTSDLEKVYESLIESEKRLSEAQKIAHIGCWERNLVTGDLYWSNEMYSIFGLNPLEGAPDYNILLKHIHPEDRDYMNEKIKRASNGESYRTDHRIILDDGEERIVHVHAEVVFNKRNIPIRIRGTVQDITERKKAEEQIQNFANIVESSNDAIGTLSLDGVITSWNKEAEKIYGYSVKEILGKSISTLAPPHFDKETIELIEKVKQGKRIQHYETTRLRKDGKIIYISFTLSPVFNIQGKMTAVSFISRDITERKKAEESMEKIEITRKQEIHHRIKNNLQVISSLLDLQAEKFSGKKNITDSEVLESFMESQNRVISMALIHEELHKGGEIDTINFSQYIEKLANNLFFTYRLGNEGTILDTDIEEDIFFDMDTSVPLGIIVNELVSNSLKHAFPCSNKGEIRIRLNREENGECEIESNKSTTFILSVSDNGIGIPEDLKIEDLDSLGIQLVTTLVDQLDGELELKRDNGTEFIVRFSMQENNDLPSKTTLPQLVDND